MEQILNLMRLAFVEGKLKCETEGLGELESFTLSNVESKVLKLVLNSDASWDSNGKEQLVDFGNEKDLHELKQELRRMMPVVSIIDLVSLAIQSDVVENSPSKKEGEGILGAKDFLAYNRDYFAITQLDQYFRFTIINDSGVPEDYNVAFKNKLCNIKKKVEYASRASRFVDILIKRIMTKYNVLVVQEASFDVNDVAHRPPLAEGFASKANQHLESVHSKTESQMKMLIHYRDHVNAETFNESVIDDIHVSFDETGNAKYDFIDIVPGDAKPSYEAMPIEDSDGIDKILMHIEYKQPKYRIFNKLRKHEKSNLHKLIQKRLKEYAKSEDKPKVEFTMSLLSIYINNIVSKRVDFDIFYNSKSPKYKHLSYLEGVKCVYSRTFDPKDSASLKYDIDYDMGDGTTKHFDITGGKDGEKLVCSLLNNPLKVSKEEIQAEVAPLSQTVFLYNEEDPFYNDPKLKNVRFSKKAVEEVRCIDGVTRKCLKSDLKTCKITLPTRKYHEKEMLCLEGEQVLHVLTNDGSDIREPQVWIANIGHYKHTCELCGAEFYAINDRWEREKNQYKLHYSAGLSARHCCKMCAGKEYKDDYFVFSGKNSDGKKYYFLDDKNKLEHTELCQCCSSNSFILKNHEGSESLSKTCDVCGQLYCCQHISTHVSGANERNICHLCYERDSMYVIYNNFDDSADEGKAIWKKIRHLLKSGKKRNFKYQLSSNKSELRVYEETSKFKRVYYFVTEEDSGVYFLRKVLKFGD